MKKIKVVTKDWMPDNEALFIYNGVEAVATLDGTNKEARYTVKKPEAVIVHLGDTPYMKAFKKANTQGRK